MNRVGRWAPPVALLALAIAGWEIAVRIDGTPAWLLPRPSAIARAMIDDRGLLAHHTWITLREVIVGLAVAVVAGVGVAIAIDASRIVERALYPLVIGSQAVPVVALAPLLLVWFGYGLLPKVIVIALIAFFPVVVTTVDGLRSADREALDMIRSMGGGRLARFRLVRAPSALPALFSGLRISVSVAVIGAVFGEYVGSKAGLGYLMNISSSRLLTARVFACIVILAAIAIGLFLLVIALERLLLPWRRHVLDPQT
jgi:ABC-type nitrate/sulfonate/bicarbonate transport system permease component